MKFIIRHETGKRIRIHLCVPKMTMEQADILEYWLAAQANILDAKVYERTSDAVIRYREGRNEILSSLQKFRLSDESAEALVPSHTGRALNAEYKEKLILRIFGRFLKRIILPYHIRAALEVFRSIHFIIPALNCLRRGKFEVPLLDGIAITASMLRGDFKTAGSVMFLLGIGELLEEWTHKKSVDDLARSLSLTVSRAWVKRDGQELELPLTEIREKDQILVRTGSMIPLDGVVLEGEGMVNQASMTGESIPVVKRPSSYVYAGTVLEEGELTIEVREKTGDTRYEQIVRMIEDSEKLKSSVESKASHLADSLVPYTLGGALLAGLIFRSVPRAMSVLMVDFSCALNLAIPISVLSGMREAGDHGITVKGGKFLESVDTAETLVFDKTGTLTKAVPKVVKVECFGGHDETEMLRIAACLEEHFPHSLATAVVQEAKERGVNHDEMHSKVNYIVAHGIHSTIDDVKVVIGSWHFVFEDEGCTVPPEEQERFDAIPGEYSQLYLAMDGVLAAVICIEDPLRENIAEVVEMLHESGFSKIVMMTGDSERTARSIAARAGVDAFYAEVLPEDKARFIEAEKAEGRTVVMVGDGINDSPALSAADVGIAIGEGAEIAREIADITISGEDLANLVTLKKLSNRLTRRIDHNYRFVIAFNLGLIGLGLFGLMPATMSALLHNASTIAVGLKSMQNLLPEGK